MSQVGMLKLTHVRVMLLPWRYERERQSLLKKVCWSAQVWRLRRMKGKRYRRRIREEKKWRSIKIIWMPTAILSIHWMCWTSLGRINFRRPRMTARVIPTIYDTGRRNWLAVIVSAKWLSIYARGCERVIRTRGLPAGYRVLMKVGWGRGSSVA